MLEDYAANSKKSKEVKRPEREALEPVVTGEVVQKQKGLGRKFKDTFLGGDAKHAAQFVTADVILPALRNLIVDMTSKGIERLVYGESNFRRRGTPGTHYNYSARYQAGAHPAIREAIDIGSRMSASLPARGRANRHDIADIIISDLNEAELVLERMIDVLEKYDVVSLADFYELLGEPVNTIDNKWGWTNLGGAQIRQIRQGYLIDLPPVEAI
jgi:hypothetical protein